MNTDLQQTEIENKHVINEENIKIVVVDSGIQAAHKVFKGKSINGISIGYDDNHNITIKDDTNDQHGHGTAVCSIISKIIPKASIYVIKIFHESLEADAELLCYTLDHIYRNIDCNIVNLSLGMTRCNDIQGLYDKCRNLVSKGITIISGFDNNGAISYPAAFNNVIGVDSGTYCKNESDFEYVESDIINIRAKGGMQRLAWINPEYMILTGTSFASAYVTAQTAKFLQTGITGKERIMEEFKRISIHRFSGMGSQIKDNRNKFAKDYFKINKAMLFPYNKEMHSIINFQDLISFEIADVCDVRFTGRVGSQAKSITGYESKKFTIQNIDKYNWENDFDTVILGHLSEIENLINKDIKSEIISKCIQYRKNIFCFDSLANYKVLIEGTGIKAYYPSIDNDDIPINRFNKLFRINSPVLGVFGTSSKQGKFTLQLLMRRKLMQIGYKVGQLGTEPQSLLFGMDAVYPMGFNSTVNVNRFQSIQVLNDMMRQIDMSSPDLIITGSQSGTVPYDTGNLTHYTVKQMEFLMGTLPDAMVLCVNPYDDLEYIARTISVLENLTVSKVICLAIYPFTYKNKWYFSLSKMNNEDLLGFRKAIKDKFNLNSYIIGDTEDLDLLIDECTDYFC